MPNQKGSFEFDYFDNPAANGYRGYHKKPYGDDVLEPWEEVTRFCLSKSIRTVADIGCAKGFLVTSLLENGIDAYGFDISDYALSFAEELPCFKHDIRNGVPKRASCLVCLGVLMYLEPHELDDVLSNIRAFSDLYFVFSAFYQGNKQRIPDPFRKINQQKKWWIDKIESYGFNQADEQAFFLVFEKDTQS